MRELMNPQPTGQCGYTIGKESWLEPDKQTPLTYISERWGNMGPLELDSAIPVNAAGFRVKVERVVAPVWATGVVTVDGAKWWTDEVTN